MLDWLEERFELSRGARAQNLRSMEGLRGFAILLVFFVHYGWSIGPWLTPSAPITVLADGLFKLGNAGVDLFFLLSGFLIFGSLIRQSQPLARYLARRVQRIYPTFTFVFLLYIVLSFVFPPENKIPAPAGEALSYLIRNFLLVPGIVPAPRMITVAWSLGYEVVFYLVVPLCIVVLAMRKWTSLARVQFFLVSSLAVFCVCSMVGGPVRVAMFLCGMLLYEVIEWKRVPVPSAGVTLAVLLAGLACAVRPVASQLDAVVRSVGLFCAFFTLALHCFERPAGAFARVFSCRPLRWLGNISYSFYLLHSVILHGCFIALARIYPPTGDGQFIFFVALIPSVLVTVAGSALLFLCVERPLSLTQRSVAPIRPTAGSESVGAVPATLIEPTSHDSRTIPR